MGAAEVLLSPECGLELGRRDVADGLQEPAVVEPVDPLQGGVLDLVVALPGAVAADQFGLVQADDRLGQRVVVGVAAGADRGDGTGFGQAFGVADGQVLPGFKGSSHRYCSPRITTGIISPFRLPKPCGRSFRRFASSSSIALYSRAQYIDCMSK